MTSPAATSETRASLARPRMRGFPVFAATLRESRSLLTAACGYIVIIGLLVGLLLPAFETLKIEAYLTGSLGALIGGATLSPNTPLFAAYLALELYGSFFMLLFGGVLAYASGASIARNIEDGTIDLSLARPVSPTRFYLEAWAAMLAGALLLLATSLATAWLCTLLFANARLHWQWFLLANVDIAALLFLKYWKRTRDGFFLAFATAFLLLGINQALLAVTNIPVEERSSLYLIRLLAFLIIIGAMWSKNRETHRGGH